MKDITDELLTRLAGKTAFSDGSGLYRENRVSALTKKRATITAMVADGDNWQVTLKHTAAVFEGACNCPASDGIDFCAHCVAVALAYRQQQTGEKAVKGAKAKDRLPTYLENLEKKELVNLVLELLATNKAKRQELLIQADVMAGKMDDKAIRKQITAAIPLNRHLHTYAQVRPYFKQMTAVVASLLPHIEKLPAEAAIDTLGFALLRIDQALHTVDDSGGFRLDVVGMLGDLYVATFARWPASAEDKASYLYQQFGSQLVDFLPAIPDGFADTLGQAGLAHFNRLVRADWDALPPLKPHDWDAWSRYSRLLTPLKQAAEATDDRGEVIALLTKVAINARDYLRLSKLCLANHQLDQALWWHKRAAKDQNKPGGIGVDELEDNQIAIWRYTGEPDKIVAALWRRFQRSPTMATYVALLQEQGEAAAADARAKALATVRSGQQTAANPWSRQRALDCEVEILLHHQQYPEALALAETRKLDATLLKTVLDHNPDQPERLLPLYFRLATHYIELGDNRHYQRAVDILRDARAASGPFHHVFAANLRALHLDYKRKRNFAQLLAEAFADVL